MNPLIPNVLFRDGIESLLTDLYDHPFRHDSRRCQLADRGRGIRVQRVGHGCFGQLGIVATRCCPLYVGEHIVMYG